MSHPNLTQCFFNLSTIQTFQHAIDSNATAQMFLAFSFFVFRVFFVATKKTEENSTSYTVDHFYTTSFYTTSCVSNLYKTTAEDPGLRIKTLQ
jgi:hypothetical protein